MNQAEIELLAILGTHDVPRGGLTRTQWAIRDLRAFLTKMEHIQAEFTQLNIAMPHVKIWNADAYMNKGSWIGKDIRLDAPHLSLANTANTWREDGGGACAYLHLGKYFYIEVLNIRNLHLVALDPVCDQVLDVVCRLPPGPLNVILEEIKRIRVEDYNKATRSILELRWRWERWKEERSQ